MRPIPPRWFSSLSSGAYLRDILLSRHHLLLLLLLPLGFVTRARKSRGRESKLNETKHDSLLFAPPPTRSVVPHAHTWVTRVYTRTHACSLSLALVLLRLVHAGPTLVLPFSSLLALSSAGEPGEVSHRPLLILSRRSTASLAVSLAPIPCRFCVSHPHRALGRPSLSLPRPSCSLARTTYQLGR